MSESGEKTGVLSVVATPIGNLEDLTMRALRILKEAELILAEDTRRTKKLLTHYGIATSVRSLHAHSNAEKVASFVSMLEEGKNLAVVTDAGTPIVSDPGQAIVDAAIKANIRVEAIPGPSAVLAALCVAGLPAVRFTFEGFLPRSGKRRRESIERIINRKEATVFFESPQRIVKTLADFKTALDADRGIAVCRELTKMHEETIRSTVGEIEAAMPQNVRGEITVVVEGTQNDSAPVIDEADVHETIEALKNEGLSAKDTSKRIAEVYSMGKRDAYQLVLEVYELRPSTKSSGT